LVFFKIAKVNAKLLSLQLNFRFSESSNIPLFTEHLKMNDRIRFSCSTNGIEQTAIHRVDEGAAIKCRSPARFVDSLVGTCMKANDSVIIRLREIPMLPNEISYKPDHDYFFISLLLFLFFDG
uniref:Ephrin RBD domain-containing protein n=1 Tax=Onchocerca flexuosa TaxID=387005 RepID=A0A183HXN5_9BILA